VFKRAELLVLSRLTSVKAVSGPRWEIQIGDIQRTRRSEARLKQPVQPAIDDAPVANVAQTLAIQRREEEPGAGAELWSHVAATCTTAPIFATKVLVLRRWQHQPSPGRRTINLFVQERRSPAPGARPFSRVDFV
jgi:hypothetical protein